MAQKQVTVVINGEEYVSAAADKAGKGLDGFGKKIPGASALAAKAAAAYYAIAEGLRLVASTIGGSLKAYDELNATQRKLEGTAKLLGVSQDYLNGIVDVGQQKFSLSRNVATEYAIEVAKLAMKSGDASSATQLLAGFLDLGAARGLTAAESLKAVQMSILGVDEGTDRFFGKNPSGLYDDFAVIIGRSASKFSEQDKAAALAYATLDAGLKVSGSYAAYLDSAAGKQDVLNQRMIEAEASFGAALQPVRMVTLELGGALMPVLGPLARVLGGALAAAVVTVAKVFNILYGNVGLAAEGLGKLTKNASMEAWGRNAAAAANALGKQLNDAGEAAGRAIRGVDDAAKTSAAQQKVVEDKRAETITAMAKLVTDAKRREGDAHQASAKEADKAFKEYLKSAEATFKMLMDNVVSYKRIVDTLGPATQKSLDPVHYKNVNDAMSTVRQGADVLVGRITAIGLEPVSSVERLQSKIRLAGVDLSTAARTTIDVASSFGILDRESASALTSVVNVGNAIAGLAKSGLSFAGVTGILGGIANIVSTMMQGDAERKRLTRENTSALEKLRTEGVRLSNKASGEQIAGVMGALTEGQANMLASLSGAGAAGRGAANQALVQLLAKQGLRLSDLDAVASELGFNLRRSDGSVETSQLPMLFQALRENRNVLTSIAPNFASQLSFFRDNQRLTGQAGTDAIGGLLSFLTGQGGIRALQGISATDPGSARAQLLGLLQQLNTGGVDAALLGSASGEQFRTILTDLIDMIDGLSSGGASAAGANGPTEEEARREARQQKLDALTLKILQTEEVLDSIRRQGAESETAKTRIAALEDDIRSARDEQERLRRRFEIEDLTRQFGTYDAPTATPAAAPDATPIESGTFGISQETIQAVIKAMDTNLVGILTTHTPLHERIAAATEGSYQRLISIDEKMDTLIAVSSGTDRIDTALEAQRRALAVQQGIGVAF